MIPDKKELGFHDVTLLDMADELEPFMSIGDLSLLRHQWPAPVLSSMSKKQMDYEKLHQDCKHRFRGGPDWMLHPLWNTNKVEHGPACGHFPS